MTKKYIILCTATLLWDRWRSNPTKLFLNHFLFIGTPFIVLVLVVATVVLPVLQHLLHSLLVLRSRGRIFLSDVFFTRRAFATIVAIIIIVGVGCIAVFVTVAAGAFVLVTVVIVTTVVISAAASKDKKAFSSHA